MNFPSFLCKNKEGDIRGKGLVDFKVFNQFEIVLKARSHCDGNDTVFMVLVSSIVDVPNEYCDNKCNYSHILRPKIAIAATV